MTVFAPHGRALRWALVAGALAAFATACARRTGPELAQPVGETHTTASSTGGARPQGVDSASEPMGVVVAEEVRRACGLPVAPENAPPFHLESARLRPSGQDILARVATCVTSGRLDDAKITLVGHTDPRGSSSYNEELGFYRATAAKQYLVDRGVPARKLVVESLGERAAKGADETSWARDRKVEIRFTGPADEALPTIEDPKR